MENIGRNFRLSKLQPIELAIYVGVIIIISALSYPAGRGIVQDLFRLKFLPELKPDSGLALIFFTGLLTSFHCLGMCGGLVLSRGMAAKGGRFSENSFIQVVIYNAGRIFSYTVIGGLVGGMGHLIHLSGVWKGFVPILGGLFMMVMGLNFLGFLPGLRRIYPSMPLVVTKIFNGNPSALVTGILSGVMPCGPLQTMQIYALSTGSAWQGAAVMFIFALGTSPLLLSVGFVQSLMNRQTLHRFFKVTAVFVIGLGLMMTANGMALMGFSYGIDLSRNNPPQGVAQLHDGYQTVVTALKADQYESITVQQGIPVYWTIKAGAKDLNGCNNAIVIPKYRIEKQLSAGDNLIRFVPGSEGVVEYTCWMGMIKSKITIVADLAGKKHKEEKDE